jgi:hypothetical protein
LVDRLGGPLEALAEARDRAELAPDEQLVLRTLPATPEFLRWFTRPGVARVGALRAGQRSAVRNTLRRVVGSSGSADA